MEKVDEAIEKVRKGDIEAYREAIRATEAKVRVVIASMVPDSNMVDDLTLEVFVIAYQRLPSYRTGTRFDLWVSSIARNVAQNERRRWYRQRNMKERYRAEIGKQIEDNIDRIAASLRGNVVEVLASCMEKLGERARELIEGFYYSGHSVRELAGGYNMSEGSVRITLHRARLAIADCMEGKGVIGGKEEPPPAGLNHE